MKAKQVLIPVLVFPIMVLVACTTSTPTPPPTPTPQVPTQTPVAPTLTPTAVPVPTTEMSLLTNMEDGYSLSYPAEYSTAIPRYIVINPAPGNGDVLGDAWVNIEVQGSNSRTADQVAADEIDAVGPGFNIERSEARVDGEPAVIVDGLPGPDAWRKVFIVHGDRLYTLTFLPWVPDAGNPGQPTRLEALYGSIMATLRFQPPTQALPTPTQPWGAANPPPALSFEVPQDGQTLDYNGDYFFKVTEIPGADGYLWSFSQNGVVVWENLRDEMGLTAGGTYVIPVGSRAHGKFVPGPVEVSVRAVQGDYRSDPAVITIILQQQ